MCRKCHDGSLRREGEGEGDGGNSAALRASLERSAHSHHMTKAAILVVAALVGGVASNPLRRSEAGVRSWLEKTTPLGSSLADVRATATRRGWYDARHRGSDGHPLRGELGGLSESSFSDECDRLLGVRREQPIGGHPDMEDDKWIMRRSA